MKCKLFSFIVIFQLGLTSCQSQQKDKEISFDFKIPQTYYYPIGELRGNIKEIIDVSESSLRKDHVDTNRYVFDNKKHIIYWYFKNKLLTKMCFDNKWILDSLIYSDTEKTYCFKTPFHERYVSYSLKNNVKYGESDDEIDTLNRTAKFFYNKRLSSIDSFDVKYRKVQMQSFEVKDTYRKFKYNKNGDLIAEYLQMPEFQEDQLVESYEYEYDEKGNWIKKILISNPNDKTRYSTFKITTIRTIIYQ